MSTTSDPHAMFDELVAANPGQGTVEEYVHVHSVIREHAPCPVLVFGVGRDSKYWIDVNEGGRTAFIEHETEWIGESRKFNPGIEIIETSYWTRARFWKLYTLRPQWLEMKKLGSRVYDEDWKVIFVDSPQGYNLKCPGRMQSIYTASVLARKNREKVDVLVHDCDRTIEREYADRYLGVSNLVHEVDNVRHYRL